MKICCISDLHGQLNFKVDQCDLLLIAGDLCPTTDHSIDRQRRWLENEFNEFLDNIPANKIICVAGNHDFVFQDHPPLPNIFCDYLNCTDTTYNGLKIFGSPWQPWFYDWAFNAPKEGGEKFLEGIYAKIPSGTDIIISHGSPFECGDKVNRGPNTGSHALREYIEKNQPKLVVTGHIHEGYGIYKIGQTTIVNASILDDQYRLVNKPVYLEL